MKRPALLGMIVAAPRSLAINGDDLGFGEIRRNAPQILDPGAEALGEQVTVDGIDQVVERVVARDTGLIRQKVPKKWEVDPAPAMDLNEILRASQRAAQHHQQDLRQGIQHLPGLARVLQAGEVIEKGR